MDMIFGNISMIYHGIVWDIHEYPIKKKNQVSFTLLPHTFPTTQYFIVLKHWLVAGRESAWFGP